MRRRVGRCLNGEEIAGSSCEKELRKTIQEKLRVEKVLKRKGMSNRKDTIIHLIVGSIKKISYKNESILF